tara:strand:- start:3355 stop:3633 length:279 start_codon:yes stop_codon:yes gene_type:complete
MSEKTHTLGPWELVQERDYLNLQEKDTNLVIAQFMGASDEDARLIAAAPELLEQCKLFEKLLSTLIMEGHSGADLERDNLQAILDRVEGETA